MAGETEKKCGACVHWEGTEHKQPARCSWPWPWPEAFPIAYKLRPGYVARTPEKPIARLMMFNEGQDCPCWQATDSGGRAG